MRGSKTAPHFASREAPVSHQQVDRILFVCTANMCRSPMAQAFADKLRIRYALPVEVTSAGLMESGQLATKYAVKTLARRGLDIQSHRSTVLAEAVSEAPDLIVAMARGHVQAVAELAEKLLDRTFVLKRLVALAEAEGPRRVDESLEDYLAKLKAADLAGPTRFASEDEVADPIGKPMRFYKKTADELQDLVQRMFDYLWPRRA